jgi:hypothetical protein
MAGFVTNKNEKTLLDFAIYCAKHPDQRFWQALRNWSDYNFIFAANDTFDLRDTFYWEGKSGKSPDSGPNG